MRSWSRPFPDPIEATGKTVRTLREVALHIQSLPKVEQSLPHWQVATEHLIYAAERGPAWMLLAWMGMMRAVNHGRSREPRKRTAKAYRTIR